MPDKCNLLTSASIILLCLSLHFYSIFVDTYVFIEISFFIGISVLGDLYLIFYCIESLREEKVQAQMIKIDIICL